MEVCAVPLPIFIGINSAGKRGWLGIGERTGQVSRQLYFAIFETVTPFGNCYAGAEFVSGGDQYARRSGWLM